MTNPGGFGPRFYLKGQLMGKYRLEMRRGARSIVIEGTPGGFNATSFQHFGVATVATARRAFATLEGAKRYAARTLNR